ncbi:class I SAM-dependent methyltransferase [Streptomyces candidus]|uniref:Ubiquinone/menaquinone biosynthesis C-methylase UbiE n=1 Tax=Streptomyces candidus TaxID=67283 RepID=A0A7X0HLU1_9ACTN|nr:class I SAM-dependent methyltransferase [Streptomyces candidus]MBB6440031.1 ubiquinone/menaquinone biosynthesis C-methylase UbiE [Streptomyces candidus]
MANDHRAEGDPDKRWSYQSDEAADRFSAAGRATDWLLGHSFVFAELRLASKRGATVLDFGCGPGEITDHISRRFGVRVLAADDAPAMLQAARKHRTPGAEYHLAVDGRVSGLSDRCADAAMCSFVLTCIPDPALHRKILAEIHRLLRPGGRLALLNINPASYGIPFTSVRTGDLHTIYAPGAPIPVRFRTPQGGEEIFTDHHWPLEHYEQLLSQVGFTDITQYSPTVDQAASIADPALFRSHPWVTECRHPPLTITAATA